MLLTTSAARLRELDACKPGYRRFIHYHGEDADNIALLECCDSNNVDDVLWLIEKEWSVLTKEQQDSIHLLACTYAEDGLHGWSTNHPNDNRPQLAIQTKKDWVAGKATRKGLAAAKESIVQALIQRPPQTSLILRAITYVLEPIPYFGLIACMTQQGREQRLKQLEQLKEVISQWQ